MIGDAYVRVTCDGECGQEEEIDLTPLAHRGSWDERLVESKLLRMGWKVVGELTYCENCSGDVADNDEEDE
jgi:hypothetical protein